MNKLQQKKTRRALSFLSLTTLAVVITASGLTFTSRPERVDFRATKNTGNYPEGLSVPERQANSASPESGAGAKARLLKSYGNLPLSFAVNLGQADQQVQFISRGPCYSLFLTPTEAVLSLHKASAMKPGPLSKPILPVSAQKRLAKADPIQAGKAATLRMKLVGGNPKPKMAGVDELPGKINYFRGEDPTQWRTHIPTYAKAKYETVYPGVDLIFYGNQRQLEYDFIVAPGADPKAVKLAFEGADNAVIDKQGDLVLHTAGGDVRWRKPVAYQTVAGQRHDVEVRFVLDDAQSAVGEGDGHKEQIKRQVAFQVAAYDAGQALVIDPVLAYSSYLGGDDFDTGFGVAVDSTGNAYVTGITSSTNFPMVNALNPDIGGANDVFVTKFNASGTQLLFSTYLGGNGSDRGFEIAVDGGGNTYVTGSTSSTNFPTVNALYPTLSGNGDAFVTKLNASGTQLLYSTYLGGNDDDGGNGIAVDSSGNAYVAGYTYSSDFPLASAVYSEFGGGLDAFVTKFNASGSQALFSTYLGGNDWDSGYAIAVDNNGNAYVTGRTVSTDFPTVNALYPALLDIAYDPEYFSDAFVTKFNASGTQVLYSTYLGGGFLDYGSGIAADNSGNAYVTGGTESDDFPTANAVYPEYNGGIRDAFVTKINAAGSKLVYSTFLGGSLDLFGFDAGSAIGVDGAGNAYVTGETDSTDFPVVGAVSSTFSGFEDAFVTKFNASGSAVLFSTYLGGTELDYGNGIAVDSAGNAYVTGATSSTDFPTHASDPGIISYDPDLNGDSNDAFIAKIAFSSQQGNDVPVANAGPDQTVNAGTKVTLNGSGSYDPDNGPAALAFSWTQTSGPSVTLKDAATALPGFTPLTPGTYVFRLVVNDGEVNSPPESVTVTVNNAAYVLIQTPNGGEVWSENSRQTIRWVSRDIGSKTRLLIFASTDNGATWKKIASTVNAGTKTWKIPKNRFVSKQALIKVCVKQNEALCDTSDSVFTISKTAVPGAGPGRKRLLE